MFSWSGGWVNPETSLHSRQRSRQNREPDLDGRGEIRYDRVLMFRAIVFLGLITAALAGEPLSLLVNASASFSAAIQQQILAIQRGPSLIEFVAKTIVYADAKAAYFN